MYGSGRVFLIRCAKLSLISLSSAPAMNALCGCASGRYTSSTHSVHFQVKPKLLRWCANQSMKRDESSRSKRGELR